MDEKIKKTVVESCRVLLGLVFVFSGFVKAVDPLGSAYKFEDYFIAFDVDFLSVFALPLSFILSALEFGLGICILLALYRRFSATITLIFMSFMTPLTLWLALTNPVHDCGCFGDALVLTNWQTFFKNILLLAAAIVLFRRPGKMKRLFPYRITGWICLYTFLFIVCLSLYCYRNLPLLDFRPYKIGKNIPEQMIVPEGAPTDQDITTFIYEKNDTQKEFTLEEAPMNDSTWTFVDAKNTVIKGYQTPVHDFVITTNTDVDVTGEILSDTSYTFLLISPSLKEAKESNADRINEIYDYTLRYGYKFYCITAATPKDISEWINNTAADYPFYFMDKVALKTIIRSNPGLLLMKNGTVYNKWHNRNIPKNSALKEPLENSPMGKIKSNSDLKVIISVSLLFLFHLLLFFWIGYKIRVSDKLKKKTTRT
ncbi:MAG: DoxX family protein [Dysgonamonadaceae bacterium]|jgi:uncharacterized membrane protein YphA (DoxX/SURF4 family)|nr:DoxX family protein [Dysgonamonadaceae bacterium]